jgi:hypothetical protein
MGCKSNSNKQENKLGHSWPAESIPESKIILIPVIVNFFLEVISIIWIYNQFKPWRSFDSN